LPKKTPPWPEHPEWTTARYYTFIRSNIRKMQMKWQPMQEAKLEGRRLKPANVPGRHKFEHQCSKCKSWVPEKLLHMDHKIPTGSIKCHADIGPFIERMLVGKKGWQKLCITCHQEKTNQERIAKSN